MRRFCTLLSVAVAMVLCSATMTQAKDPLRILVLGDSFMTSHAQSDQAYRMFWPRHWGPR